MPNDRHRQGHSHKHNARRHTSRNWLAGVRLLLGWKCKYSHTELTCCWTLTLSWLWCRYKRLNLRYIDCALPQYRIRLNPNYSANNRLSGLRYRQSGNSQQPGAGVLNYQTRPPCVNWNRNGGLARQDKSTHYTSIPCHATPSRHTLHRKWGEALNSSVNISN